MIIKDDLILKQTDVKYSESFLNSNYLVKSLIDETITKIPYFDFVGKNKHSDNIIEVISDSVTPKYISRNFFRYYLENYDKIKPLINLKDINLERNECIIYNHLTGTDVFHIFSNSKEIKIVSFVKVKSSSMVFYDYYYFTLLNNDFGVDMIIYPEWISIDKKRPYYVIAVTLDLLWFLKYCETETKFLPPLKKDKINKEKYYNKSNSIIEVIDSTWFTTLVQSDSFKVRGHFRMQPYGKNLCNKKLIWISEFQKSGYTRKYKK